MNILEIEEIVLCLYKNMDVKEKLKLSALSTKYYRLVTSFHKMFKTVFKCNFDNRYDTHTYQDDNYLYLSDIYNNEVICINHKTFEQIIIKKHRPPRAICECSGKEGIIIHDDNTLIHIKFLPAYSDNILIDNIEYHGLSYCINNKLFVLNKKQIDGKECDVLEYYKMGDKLEFVSFIKIPTYKFFPTIIGNDINIYLIYWCTEKHVIATFDIQSNMIINEIDINKEYEINIIDDNILLYDKCLGNLYLNESSKPIYTIPKNYYIIDDKIKKLTLPLSVLVLVHNYYYVEDDSCNFYPKISLKDTNYQPACIIVVLSNKTWDVVHREEIYTDYAANYYTVGNTVFIDCQCENKIMAFNFENL